MSETAVAPVSVPAPPRSGGTACRRLCRRAGTETGATACLADPDRRGQRGFALVMVLWVLSLMAAIAIAVTADGRSAMRVAQNRMTAAQARALAEGGVWWGIGRLTGSAAGPRTDGSPYRVPLEDRAIDVALQDESGRIDLNKAPPELLEGLLRQGGAGAAEARRLAGAIGDGRNGGRGFRTVEELRQRPGIEAGLFERIAPWLTVSGADGRINPTKAGLPVLLAVPGIDRRAAEAYLRARADDPPSAVPPPPGAEAYLTGLAGRVVTIRSTAVVEGGAVYVQEATVELVARGRQPFGILAWRRGTEPPP